MMRVRGYEYVARTVRDETNRKLRSPLKRGQALHFSEEVLRGES